MDDNQKNNNPDVATSSEKTQTGIPIKFDMPGFISTEQTDSGSDITVSAAPPVVPTSPAQAAAAVPPVLPSVQVTATQPAPVEPAPAPISIPEVPSPTATPSSAATTSLTAEPALPLAPAKESYTIPGESTALRSASAPAQSETPVPVPATAEVFSPASTQSEATPPTTASEATQSEAVHPNGKQGFDIRYILVGILGVAFIIVGVLFYISVQSFLKGEERIITIEPDQTMENIYGAALETIEEATCNPNEFMDEQGSCVCKTNFIRPSGSKGACYFDCVSIIQKIKTLKTTPSSQLSPEDVDTLNTLLQQAADNSCSVPEMFKDICQQYQDDALNSLAGKDFMGYYELSKKYIEANCSNKNLDSCGTQLAIGELINKILASRPPEDTKASLKQEMANLKLIYYHTPQCTTTEITTERCEQIRSKYGIGDQATTLESTEEVREASTQSKAGSSQIMLDPSKVFFDDREFFYKYCIPQSQQTEQTQQSQEVTVKRVPRIKR